MIMSHETRPRRVFFRRSALLGQAADFFDKLKDWRLPPRYVRRSQPTALCHDSDTATIALTAT
jgi:hypothetical protein